MSHAATQDRALQSIFFPDKEKSLEREEQKAITQEVKEEENHAKMEQASVLDGAVSAVKEEDGNPTKVEENVTLKEKTQAVKLKFDFASLPPPPPLQSAATSSHIFPPLLFGAGLYNNYEPAGGGGLRS